MSIAFILEFSQKYVRKGRVKLIFMMSLKDICRFMSYAVIYFTEPPDSFSSFLARLLSRTGPY